MYIILISLPHYYPRTIKRFGFSINNKYNEIFHNISCSYSYKPILNLFKISQIQNNLFDENIQDMITNIQIIQLIEFFKSKNKYAFLKNLSNKIKAA
jgi:hypothetical protein